MSGNSEQISGKSSHLPPPPASLIADSEIDLKDLFQAIWKGKLIIIGTAFIFAIFSVIYALNAQEWWSSKAQITLPQKQDYSGYQQQVKQVQSVFDVYQEDGTVLVSEELEQFINPELMLKRFVVAFNSSVNKQAFLESSSEFHDLSLNKTQEINPPIQTRSWFNKIAAQPVGKNEAFLYNLSFQSTTKQSSLILLNKYIEMIEQKVKDDALNNLHAMIKSKMRELTQQKTMIESQASDELAVTIQRNKYAYEIALSAGIIKPIRVSNQYDYFNIALGAEIIKNKIKVLESVSNLSIVEPRLQKIDAKIKTLNLFEIDRVIDFNTVRFLEKASPLPSRDQPKRAIIAILGTLLGGITGLTFVLTLFALRRLRLVK
ncbi:LPS chain length-determining protein [Vibrio tubiashii]|uniref:LPS chain length-determining protein n=1 Tax=Vibrio tubiashii TaxID=29498 RepID=A0AAE5GT28_9VIBR|nr:LPS chain length-determining protein [Vibrio tubiashii]